MQQEPVDKRQANKTLIISGIIIAIFLVGLFTNGFGLFNRDNSNNNNNKEYIPLEIGSAPVLGDANASVTIYEFSDFSCPYCAASAGYNQPIIDQLKDGNPGWEAPIPKIKEKYIDTGKVKLVYKYSRGHGTGKPAHLVGWCLNEQNLFWQFHDKAFESQQNTNNINKMKDIAESLGANMQQLNECLDSKKYDYLFDEDSQMGISNGVSGTPTFFINGKTLEGAQSYSNFERIIENELK